MNVDKPRPEEEEDKTYREFEGIHFDLLIY